MAEPTLLAQEMASYRDGASSTDHRQGRQIWEMAFDVAEYNAADAGAVPVLAATARPRGPANAALARGGVRGGARGGDSDDWGSRFRRLHNYGAGSRFGLGCHI